MLPDVAAEALRFLTRRELDNACGASKWLDAMIARSCDVFSLRSVRKVALYPCWNGFTLKVWTDNDDSGRDHSFKSLDDAAGFAVLVLRRSYVGDLQVTYNLLREHTEEVGSDRYCKIFFSRFAFGSLDFQRAQMSSFSTRTFV